MTIKLLMDVLKTFSKEYGENTEVRFLDSESGAMEIENVFMNYPDEMSGETYKGILII